MTDTTLRERLARYVGEKLRRRRLAIGRTLSQVADEVGVHPSTISRIESGKMLPSTPDLAQKLWQALDLDKATGWRKEEFVRAIERIREGLDESEARARTPEEVDKAFEALAKEVDRLFPPEPWREFDQQVRAFPMLEASPSGGMKFSFPRTLFGDHEPMPELRDLAERVGWWIVEPDRKEWERVLHRAGKKPEEVEKRIRTLLRKRLQPEVFRPMLWRVGRPRKGEVRMREIPACASLEEIEGAARSHLLLPAPLVESRDAKGKSSRERRRLRAVELPPALALGEGLDLEPGDWAVFELDPPFPGKRDEGTYLVRAAALWLLARRDADGHFRGATRDDSRIESPAVTDEPTWKKLVKGRLVASLRRED